jgi:PAS domain S-box-containing protein
MRKNLKSRSTRLVFHFWGLVFAWTVIVAALAVSDALHIDKTVREMAIAEARTHLNKDQAFRLWASSHGGVYVPTSDRVPPNPYLSHIPERDIQTPAGRPLTLMNPAYMIRHIMEQYNTTYGVYGHITSLKHFRQETAPDAWETTALKAFEKGEKEALEFAEIQEKPYLRLMRPMVAEQDCLKCHDFQGYKVGDIRGGVSVSVPMEPYQDARLEEILAHSKSFGVLWVLGFIGIGFATYALRRGIRARDEAEESLRNASLYTRNLIEASLDPLVTISAEGKIMDVNSATELTAGVPRHELIGTDFSDYFVEPEKAREGYQRVFQDGFVRDYPLSILHRLGRVTDVLYNAAVYRNEAGVVQGVFAAARDVTERKRAEEELRRKEEQIRLFASQCLTAQETERRRIAAELHDSIVSSLVSIKFRIERAREDMKKGPGDFESMKDLSSSLAETLGEVRRIMADLRPSILDDLGIIPALNWLSREYEKIYSHISVQKQIGISEGEVPDPLKTVIFRISQEALNNIAKYSNASLVSVSVQKIGQRIELTIHDNGHGFQPDEIERGLGLSSMRERTVLSGGTFSVESSEETGTVIRASWALAL